MTAERVATVAGDGDLEARIAAELGLRSDTELVMRCLERTEFLAVVRGGIDVVIVAGIPSWLDRADLDEASARTARVFVLTTDVDSAARLAPGVMVLAPSTTMEELLTRGASLQGKPMEISDVEPLPPSQPGRLIAVWGPKGSPGTTRIAIELAFQLARFDRATILIDGDPYGGDIFQLLGLLEEIPTVVWAARMARKGELDLELLIGQLRRVSSRGPFVLPGLTRAELWSEVSAPGWEQLLKTIRTSLSYGVLDTGFCLERSVDGWSEDEGRNRMTRSSVAAADQVVGVCRSDPIGVKSFVGAWKDLVELVDPVRIVVVANCSDDRTGAEVASILADEIGVTKLMLVPHSGVELRSSLERGRAVSELHPRSHLSAAIRSIADGFLQSVQTRPGRLRRLVGRRS